LFQRIVSFVPSVVLCAFKQFWRARRRPALPASRFRLDPCKPKIKAACTQCHNTGRITEQHLTRQQWSDELEKMEGLGAVIPDADRNALLNYLTRNFGPKRARRSQQRSRSQLVGVVDGHSAPKSPSAAM
jgi:hypothetical protein